MANFSRRDRDEIRRHAMDQRCNYRIRESGEVQMRDMLGDRLWWSFAPSVYAALLRIRSEGRSD